ncbi:vitamin D-binding protein [Denticeps clupeoides]|uniref:vitamin D-binding protein n=1 Tax=Denticeps clupeoides TaxID=299321 RepID=UPI0010A3F6F8|nr:vitamin D-binding protein-like [Denticeps clupeoides]
MALYSQRFHLIYCKRYEKEKVCQELQAIGQQKFRELFTALYSQKFPNSSMTEVTCLMDETVRLAERCCTKDASDDCYDKGATEISERSCQTDSPFPKHPGIGECCAKEGQERKLCLALLSYADEELPSLLEPSNEEICIQYRQDAGGYSTRFVYEFARRHRSLPVGFVLNATNIQLQMVEKCCSPSTSKTCFFNEHFDMSYLLTGYIGSLLKTSFEKSQSLAKIFQEALSKCCLQPSPECIIQKFTRFQNILCNETSPASISKDFQACCIKAPLETLFCMENLKRQPHQLPGGQQLSSAICEKGDAIERYLFMIGANQTSASVPVVSTVLEHIRTEVTGCCSGTDTNSCLMQKEDDVRTLTALLSKTDSYCAHYFRMDFPAFKTLIQGHAKGEQAKKAARVEALLDLSSTCCFQHSPALRCQKLTQTLISHETGTGV